MDLTQISIFFSIVALVLGLLLSSLLMLRKGKTLAFKLLTANLLLISLFIGYSLVLKAGLLYLIPHAFKIPVTLIILLGPLSFLIIRALVSNETKFLKTDLLHFLPFVLYFLELLPFFLHSKEYKLNIIQSLGRTDLISLIEYEVGFFPNIFHSVLIQLSNIIYVIAGIFVYISAKNNKLTYIENDPKNKFALTIILIKSSSLILTFIAILVHHINAGVSELMMNISLSAMIFTLAIMLFKNPDYLYGDNFSFILSKNQQILNTEKALVRSNLMAMTNSSIEANVFLSTNCKVIYYNNLAEKRIKLVLNAQVAVGDDFRKYLQPEVLSSFNDAFEQAIIGHLISFEIQQSIGYNDFVEWFQISLIPVYDYQNNLMGISFKAINIDRIKKIEFNNQTYIKKLEAIAWQEAHILRAPIANLIGLSRLLKKNTDHSKRPLFISQIYQEVERLSKNINEITNSSNQILIER